MRSILAIDGATTTGWALWREDMARPRANTIEMPDTAKIGLFCHAMAEWLVPFCRLERVTEIIIEAPIIVQHKDQRQEPCEKCGRIDHTLNIKEVDKLFGIVHATEMAAVMAGAESTRVARSTVVKHIAGTGRGTRKQFKQYCLLGCQLRGWNVTSEDMADALATLDWYTWDRKIKVPWNNQAAAFPIFEGQHGVRIDKGNEIAANVLVNKVLSFDAGKG